MPGVIEVGLTGRYIADSSNDYCTFVSSLTEESEQYTLSDLINLLPYFSRCFKSLYCVQLPELGDLLRK